MEVLIDALKIRVAWNVRTEEQSFDFTREDDAAAVVVIVDLFDPEWIARQGEATRPRVPESESKDAGDLGERFRPRLLHEVDQSLSIGGTPEAMASGKKALSEGRVIIKLAVVCDPTRTVLVRHGLCAGGGKVDNGKPAMAESEASVKMEAFPIRPAVGKGPRHADQQIAVHRVIRFSVMKDSCNSAH